MIGKQNKLQKNIERGGAGMYRKSGKYKNYCRKRRKWKDDILKSVIKILKGMSKEEKKKRTEFF